MYETKLAKCVLLAAVFVLMASNVITIRTVIKLRNMEKAAAEAIAAESGAAEKYRLMYEKLRKENSELKARVEELEKYAEKWNIFEERHEKTSRGATDIIHSLKPGVKLVLKRMRVTAYTEFECDKDPDHPQFGITNSGNKVEAWYTAAAGPEIPFGTRIYIPYFKDCENGGIFVVEDRGGAIKNNCIDIYIPNQRTVDEFGCKWLDVYIIEE